MGCVVGRLFFFFLFTSGKDQTQTLVRQMPDLSFLLVIALLRRYQKLSRRQQWKWSDF